MLKRLKMQIKITGVAARNINGVTLHRALCLGVEKFGTAPYIKLGSKRLSENRKLLEDVILVILDEISMVSFQTLRMVSLRLGEIKNNDLPFGGLNVLLFGDLLQLPNCQGKKCIFV